MVDVRTDSPTTKFSADMKGVRVNPLLQDVLGKDILEGTTQAHINLSMAGDNAAAIKRTLNGSGQLTFLDGAIKGFDLAAMVRNTTAAFGLEQKSAERPKTDFAELSVPFTITNGLFNTPDTAMKSPFLRLDAKGDAHLVEETLDFRVDPKVVATLRARMEAVQRQPRSSAAWGWLGAILWAYDFRAEARVCLSEAERLDPTNPRWPYYHALSLIIATS